MLNFNSLFDLMTAFPDEVACVEHLKSIRWRNGEYCPIAVAPASIRSRTERPSSAPRSPAASGFRSASARYSRIASCRSASGSWRSGSSPITPRALPAPRSPRTWTSPKRVRGSCCIGSATPPAPSRSARRWMARSRLTKPTSAERRINRHGGKSGVGGGAKGKTGVIGAIERKGPVIARVMESHSSAELTQFVRETVSPDAELLATDEHLGYRNLKGYPSHERVNHSARQYVIGRAHTNSIESVWALLKRQIVGVHHWVSPKHLGQYVGEMTWRFNRRE